MSDIAFSSLILILKSDLTSKFSSCSNERIEFLLIESFPEINFLFTSMSLN